MRTNLRELADAASHDPAAPLLAAAGDLSDYEIFHNLALVATYIPPPKVMKGPNGEDVIFHETDNNQAENRFQGKVGLVLKIGPTAFHDDSVAKFGGIHLRPGDWVVYRPSDGHELFIRDRRKFNEGLSCRLIEDVFIRGRVSDPSLIY
jgi:hypothetical protein